MEPRAVFPDIEKLLVGYLTAALSEHYGAGAVRVGTIKTPPGAAQPTREVVVTANYQGDYERVLQSATGVFEVYADTYESANDLALYVAALAVNIPRDHVKRAVVVMGPVRDPEDGPQEKRNVMVDYTVKGVNL